VKGLKLVEIKSQGFKLDFNRWLLTEHQVLTLMDSGKNHWSKGRIIAVLRNRKTAEQAFLKLAKEYDVTEFDFY